MGWDRSTSGPPQSNLKILTSPCYSTFLLFVTIIGRIVAATLCSRGDNNVMATALWCLQFLIYLKQPARVPSVLTQKL